MDDLWSWALDKGTAASVKALVKAGVTAAIAGGAFVLTRSLKARGEVRVAEGCGRTRQSPQVFVLGVLCGLVAFACLLWGLLDPASLDEPGAGVAWLLLIVGFTSGFLATAVYAQHRWTWDGERLDWQGAFRRVAIAWRDLEVVGRSWDGQFVARDGSGRTIRWTTYALEHAALNRAAQENLALNRARGAQAASTWRPALS